MPNRYALILLSLAGCGQPTHTTATREDPCGPGYTLAAGRCVDDPCALAPCVFGTCTPDGTNAVCACLPGYAGARCDRCVDGYHVDGLGCVVSEGCAVDPCEHGVCRVEDGAPVCDCNLGYEGVTCDTCAEGYFSRDGECVSETPCDPDPCVHGACVDDGEGRASCTCKPGYAGERCEQCVDGYHPEGLFCLPDISTACDPNPCLEANRTRCLAEGDTYTCLCDIGTVDRDGACVPSDPIAPSDCGAEVRIHPSGAGPYYVRGEFNGWSLTDPLLPQPDGTVAATFDLPAGDYAYKLFDQSANRWFEDPENPYFKWVDGSRNSRLRAPDCDAPRLVITSPVTVAGSRIQFSVQLVAGADPIDPTSVQLTRNDVPRAASIDDGVLVIDDDGLATGKYTYRITARDTAGRTTDRLYVPVWVEDEPFQWQDAILYFALTDRFADGDPSNNAPTPNVDPKANWQGGDFAGLEAKIESGYFDRLGVNAIWISSVTQNTSGAGVGLGGDGHLYSAYHSYWPIATGWREGHELEGVSPIEPHFGTLDELQSLVRAAHARGIRVLVDFVANHVHQDSPLWQQHGGEWFHDLYICGWERPITCWFADYLPDFEYKNLDVLEAVVEHAIWLIEETDVDGFRLDAVKHMVHDFSYALRGRIEEEITNGNTRFYLVGETFTGEGEGAASLIREYVRPQELDGQFDFPLYWQIVATLLREERTLHDLAATLEQFDGYYGSWAVMSSFLGNHDVARAISHAAGDVGDLWGNGSKEQGWSAPPVAPSWDEPYQRLRLAWTFLMTTPGIPLIYYGDEVGLPGAGDPDNRRMMRFGDALTGRQRDTLAHVQALGAIRRAHPALRHGERRTLHMDDDGLLWAYGYTDGLDRVVVVLNRHGEGAARQIPVGALGLTDGTTLHDALSGATAIVTSGALSISVGGRSSAVFVIEGGAQ